MRTAIGTLGLLMALSLTAPAQAQRTLSSFGSPSPSQIVFQPIDMSHAIAPPLVQPPRPSRFATFLSNLSLTRFLRPPTSTTSMPVAGAFPNGPIVSPIQPLPTVIPSQQ